MTDVSVTKPQTTDGAAEDKMELSKIFEKHEETIGYILEQDESVIGLFANLFEDFGNRLIDLSDLLNRRINRRLVD